MEITYKNIDGNFIIDWCNKNGQNAWLKATCAKMVEDVEYPKVKSEKTGRMVADKSQPATKIMRKISYIEVKNEFVKTFMPDLLPKSNKKKGFFDIVAGL